MWGQHFCSCVPPNPTTSSILKLNSKSEYIYFNTLLFWNKYLLILQLCFHWIYSKKKINKYYESWIWTYYMYIYRKILSCDLLRTYQLPYAWASAFLRRFWKEEAGVLNTDPWFSELSWETSDLSRELKIWTNWSLWEERHSPGGVLMDNNIIKGCNVC